MVAFSYVLGAMLSQHFAIEPGNVTPVWIPSGVMLAFALLLGNRVAFGVFLGAFVGNISAYFTLENAFSAIGAATLNGIGDVLAIVSAAIMIRRFTDDKLPFNSLSHLIAFGLFGAVIGALVSALFGITGLYLFSFIQASDYVNALMNWWVGDGVGVLLLTPLVLSLFFKPLSSVYKFYLSTLFSIVTFSLFTALVFKLVEFPLWAVMTVVVLTPVAFALTLNTGQRAVYIVQVVVAGIAVIATERNLGPFASTELMPPLLALQLFVGILSCVIIGIALVVHQKQALTLQLQQQQKTLESLYQHDPLTGVWNRYRIEDFLQIELNRFQRQNTAFAVFLIDIDDFKVINDTFGHLEGDRILVEFAQAIDKHIRDSDLFGRWGGEEFIIIAEKPTRSSAQQFADKIIAIIDEHDFALELPVTASIGFAMCIENDSKPALLARADEALYTAKSQGKHRAIGKWN